MVSGRLIGVDVGKVRVGIAQAYLDTILALPVKTLKVQADGSELEELASFIREETTTAVFVGLPRLLNGKEGEAARMARSYARRLARKISPIPVRLIDERLSSVTAHEKLRAAGVSTREHKKMVDQVAAQQILEQAIEMSNIGTDLTGELVIID
ncbi:Holliday junction resolvase RuvX [Mobiluncus mulieris]|uniref:Holliday junction resolvase RuvX n=1 Tax=Mobiluncus mulieris TaxID=2052 RepID=UPI0002DB38A0